MAVKASATITLTQYRDTQSVTRYYKLQPAGSSAPLKPETKPPSSDWTDSEPACDISKELYFCDLTIFSNGEGEYSKVSKSSSYEASKEAYNKAQSAQDSVDGMPNYIASRGENLVTNGTCLLGSNYNFTQFTYDGSDTYYSGGCFKIVGKGLICSSNEYIPVDVNSSYKLSYYMKCDDNTAKHYDMLRMYDIDKLEIYVYYVMFITGSTTTLAQDLKPGDKTVYLTDASGFDPSRTETYRKGFIFWNYKNSYGYQYPPETYSRYRYQNLWTTGSTAIDKTNNTITLDKAWTGPTFPAGTSVSQCSDGGTYSYGNANFGVSSDDWTLKTATWSGVGRNNEGNKFREGTAFVRIGWYMNYNINTTSKISTIELTKNSSISEVNEVNKKADNAQTTADEAQGNALSAEEAADALDQDLIDFKSNEYSQINNKVGELVEYKGENEKEIGKIREELSQELVAQKFARVEPDKGSLILGEINGTTAVLTNEQFGFYTPNSEIAAAYFGKDNDAWAFNIERGIIKNDLRFSGFQWIARSNKNMSLKWIK